MPADRRRELYQAGVRPRTRSSSSHARGDTLGPTVIVAVGYNDFEDEYAGNIEDAIDALKAAGVKRVLWRRCAPRGIRI